MIGQIAYCVFVGNCRPIYRKYIFVIKGVAYKDLHISGIALITVGTVKHKENCIWNFIINYCKPHFAAKTVKSAVQMITPIVYRELIIFSVKSKLAVSNSSAASSDSSTEVCSVKFITVNVLIAENYISNTTVFVGNFYRNDTCA